MKTRIFFASLISLFIVTLKSTPIYAFNISQVFYNDSVLKPGYTGPATISAFLEPIIITLYTIGGFFSFIGLLYGGFLYIMGASSGNAERIQTGNRVMTWSLIGIALLLSVFWIIQILEIVTGTPILNNQNL